MRSPLQTILLTARTLTRRSQGEELSSVAQSLVRSGAAIQALVEDLVDFSRTHLGEGIVAEVSKCDLGCLLKEEVEQAQLAHPETPIVFSAAGDVSGKWDGPRLQRVLRNLLSNAIAYGARRAPVAVRLEGTARGISFSVTNSGAPIPADRLDRLFNPLQRGVSEDAEGARGHLGIGLYIVREVIKAHGGTVNVHSDPAKTVFTVELPREVEAARKQP